ncbi:MAG: COR domain-containing protein [Candidatus Binatia bacterium]
MVTRSKKAPQRPRKMKQDPFAVAEQRIQAALESGARNLTLSVLGLTELPSSISHLAQLQLLDVSDNQLAELPESIGQLSQLQQLFLHSNPALRFPLEVLGPHWGKVTREKNKPASPSSILEYYFRNRVSRPLNEAKMILVGRGGVGKTSLGQRLVHEKFDANEKKTDGIAITPWQVKVGDDQVRLNIWDFGGQEIMHATHQFFMTKRSLYLLVIDVRAGKHESNIEYWLRLIESFGGDSPVVVVINKIKEHPLDLNRRGLQQKFPNIRDFLNTDCAANIGIEKLLRAIQRETDRLPNLRDPFPASWFMVKDHLRDLQENFISYEQYQTLCSRNGVTETQSQHTLVGFLHDLGIVVNFREDQRLADTHVLNPHWVTNGIYKVLNTDTLARKQGELRLQDLAHLLDAKVYPPHMHRFLYDLMEKFELGYEFYDNRGQYLVPELLSEEEPAGLEEFAETDALRFAYHYNVLPEGLLPRFIVRSRALNTDLPRWRTGAVLAFEGNRALVKADSEDRVVSISVIGNPPGRRRLLSVIRSDFERIHHSISRLKVEEKIPIPGQSGVVVDYETLQVLENEKETELKIIVNGKLLKLNVSDLLNGVEDPAARTQDTEREMHTAFKEAVNVVFSYSHKDEALRDQLATHLKILERNQVIASWHDRKIPPGDEWKNAIDANFQRVDLVLLLVSADFIASDYCYETEMTGALERREKGEAEVVPIIVRPCRWQIAPFSKLQALPKNGEPVTSTSWNSPDDAWLNVEEGIEKAAEEIRRRRK